MSCTFLLQSGYMSGQEVDQAKGILAVVMKSKVKLGGTKHILCLCPSRCRTFLSPQTTAFHSRNQDYKFAAAIQETSHSTLRYIPSSRHIHRIQLPASNLPHRIIPKPPFWLRFDISWGMAQWKPQQVESSLPQVMWMIVYCLSKILQIMGDCLILPYAACPFYHSSCEPSFLGQPVLSPIAALTSRPPKPSSSLLS